MKILIKTIAVLLKKRLIFTERLKI